MAGGSARVGELRKPADAGESGPTTGKRSSARFEQGWQPPGMRILIVSQMYPGPDDPDLGAFVAQIERELASRGQAVEVAAVDRRGGSKAKHLSLGADTLRSAARFRPDVIYAHFLFPAGAIAATAAALTRTPLVLTAHGRDVRNIGAIPGVRAATQLAVRRADAVIAVSEYLRSQLALRLGRLPRRVAVINSGVDLGRFRGSSQDDARAELAWEGDGPHYLFVGSLEERKNVRRLVEALERLEQGTLVLVGDGPLRSEVEGRPRVRVIGRVAHDRIPRWLAACDVLCLPRLVEPVGQALLEAMACERSVLATRVGGPPEFVTEEAGVLVDPTSVDSIEAGLREAASFPSPNPAARAAAAESSLPRQVERILELLEAACRREKDRGPRHRAGT
jgi:glycosyltransferase involved in cell wall biosynthesis